MSIATWFWQVGSRWCRLAGTTLQVHVVESLMREVVAVETKHKPPQFYEDSSGSATPDSALCNPGRRRSAAGSRQVVALTSSALLAIPRWRSPPTVAALLPGARLLLDSAADRPGGLSWDDHG